MSPVPLLPFHKQASALLPTPPLTLFSVSVVPRDLSAAKPGGHSQSSHYLPGQPFVTVEQHLSLETLYHLGSWDTTGSWFSSYFLLTSERP